MTSFVMRLPLCPWRFLTTAGVRELIPVPTINQWSYDLLPEPNHFPLRNDGNRELGAKGGKRGQRRERRRRRRLYSSQVTWYLDGHRVMPDGRHEAEEHGTLAVLRLRELSVRELGNYSCQAENSQGVARDHIELSGESASTRGLARQQ